MTFKINKYPFLLWITEKRDDFKLKRNLKTNQRFVDSEASGVSNISPVSKYKIFMLKYLPLICILPFLYYPIHNGDIFPFIGGLIVFCLFVVAYLKTNINYLKYLILFISVINIALMFYFEDYAIYLDTTLTFFIEITLIGIVFIDFYFLQGLEDWYYLEEFHNEVNIKLSQKKERKFLFFKKTTGFNIDRKFVTKGYFLQIPTIKGETE